MLGDLPVKINPHFGLRHADGRGEAVRLHFDEAPPSEEATLATLHLMARHMDAVLPNAEPVLVDVRRGEAHRMPTDASPSDRALARRRGGRLPRHLGHRRLIPSHPPTRSRSPGPADVAGPGVAGGSADTRESPYPGRRIDMAATIVNHLSS